MCHRERVKDYWESFEKWPDTRANRRKKEESHWASASGDHWSFPRLKTWNVPETGWKWESSRLFYTVHNSNSLYLSIRKRAESKKRMIISLFRILNSSITWTEDSLILLGPLFFLLILALVRTDNRGWALKAGYRTFSIFVKLVRITWQTLTAGGGVRLCQNCGRITLHT